MTRWNKIFSTFANYLKPKSFSHWSKFC